MWGNSLNEEKGKNENENETKSEKKRNVIYNNFTLKQIGNEKKMMIILHESNKNVYEFDSLNKDETKVRKRKEKNFKN